MVKKEGFEAYEEMGKELANLNTKRGGSSEQLKGFVAEITNTTEANIDRIHRGIVAREYVIDDNGPADAIIKYANGQAGRSIQDKCGYTYSALKKMIEDGKYDGQILRINPDHPVFENENHIKELNKLAKAHGMKIDAGSVSSNRNKELSDKMVFEGKVRSMLNMDTTAPVTAKVYTVQKQAEYVVSETKQDIYNVAENVGGEKFAQINQESMDAAIGAMSVAAITTLVDNSVKVARGEKTKEEAVRDSAKTIGETGITRYTQKTVTQITENVINKTMQESTFKSMAGKAGNDVAVVVVKTGQEFVKYCKNEISVDDMLENTSEIITEQIVQFMGGMLFSVIPIPGSEYIGRYVATVLYHSAQQTKMDQKKLDNYISFMGGISRETTREIEKYREEFAAYTTSYNAKAMEQLSQSFLLLDQGLNENNIEKSSQAIELLANMVGETVCDITEDQLFGQYWIGE